MRKVIFFILVIVLVMGSVGVVSAGPEPHPDGCNGQACHDEPMKCQRGNRKTGHPGHGPSKQGC